MVSERQVAPERVGMAAGPPGFIAARVPAMGWISAVGVCQHLARNLLREASRVAPPLPLNGEFRRTRPGPLTGRQAETS
eukprot:2708404-Lingulodinium_polyedra.AAC.1